MTMQFIISFFGMFVGLRTVDFLISSQLIVSLSQQQIRVVFVLIYLIFEIFVKPPLILNLALDFFLLILPATAFLVQERLRRIDFEKNLVNYLDVVLISLQMGRSFRESVSDLAVSQKGAGRFYLHELYSLLQFSNNDRLPIKNAVFDEVLREFLEINKSQQRVFEQVRAFRRKISTLRAFRQKSGRVTVQVRAQSSILSALYLCLILYTLLEHDMSSIKKTLAVSIGLYVFGTFISLRIPRRFKWKT